nr:MAG TPA: hypothetical protein [Caudoviricetes sp.]DAW28524.1 MAG TPA: hypothetical protein [Caudoviricetes sp.]
MTSKIRQKFCVKLYNFVDSILKFTLWPIS